MDSQAEWSSPVFVATIWYAFWRSRRWASAVSNSAIILSQQARYSSRRFRYALQQSGRKQETTRRDKRSGEKNKKKKKTVLVLLFFLEIQLLLEVIEPTVELLHVVDVCDG
jgi:hypothetical protein